MAKLRLTDESARAELGVTSRSARTYKASGCPGFSLRSGKLFFDPVKVREWMDARRPNKPGPKPQEPDPQEAAAAATSSGAGSSTSILDPELQAELATFKAGLGDGPLEEEIALCRRLFGRLSELVLTWDAKRLEDVDEQGAFCDVTKTLTQVTSRIERMEGRLIDLRKRHGELVTRDEAMVLVRDMFDGFARFADRLVDHLVASAQEQLPDVDADLLRSKVQAAKGAGLDELAKEQRSQGRPRERAA